MRVHQRLVLKHYEMFQETTKEDQMFDKCKNSLLIKIESGDKALTDQTWPEAVLVAVDSDPYELVQRSISLAAKLSGGGESLVNKAVPRSLDYFGWCSWDAFYSSVSALDIFRGVESLQGGNAPPRFVIIDDGWQQTDLDSDTELVEFTEDAFNTNKVQLSKRHIHNGAFIAAESRALAPAMRNIPEGSSSGAALQELIEITGQKGDLQYHSLAIQHERKRDKPEEFPDTCISRTQRRLGNFLDAVAGYSMGLLEIVFLSLYEAFVDPASNGSWKFELFSKLAQGPLRGQILNFIADQTNFSRRLTNIEANSKFQCQFDGSEHKNSPDLKSVVQHLKDTLHVDFVICWHGISAYWSGVSLEAAEMAKYAPHNVHPDPQDSLLEVEPSMKWNPTVLVGMGALYDPFRLYDDMHRYLFQCGVSGVKVDCQAGVGLVGSVTGGGASVAKRYHDALEASTAKHFDENLVINCMCHTIDNIYHWRRTAVARASDDFYPSDKASHLAHIVACAYNGLFLSPLVIPDFDMFQSNHEASEAHAVARAVSGGPVYVSDGPGKHDFSVLKRLVLVNGTVLRAKQPCRPTIDCFFSNVTSDMRSALKLWSLNYSSAVIGVFNVQGSSWDREKRKFRTHDSSPGEVQASIKPSDIPIFDKQGYQNEEFLLACTSGNRSIWKVVLVGDVTEISLAAGQAIAVTIVPVYKFKVRFCPVGLEGMINGGGSASQIKCFVKEWITMGSIQATLAQGIHWEEVERIRLEIIGCGVFLIYCDACPVSCTVDGSDAESQWFEDTCKLAIRIPEPQGDPKKSSLQHEIFLSF